MQVHFTRIWYVIIVIFFLSTMGLVGQENFPVSYSDGSVEVTAGSGWKPLEPGDSVSGATRIRIGRGGVVEIALPSGSLTLSKPGTYLMGDLLSSSKTVSSWNLTSLVSNKLKVAVNPERSKSVAVMGVRAEAAAGPSVQWVETSPDPQLDEGRSHIKAGRFDAAIEALEKGLPVAEKDETGIYHYLLAVAYAEKGMNGPAAKHLKDAKIDAADPSYGEYVLLKGRYLIEGTDFQEALALFQDYLKVYPNGSGAQAVLILSSFCRRGLGQASESRNDLEKAVSLEPGSDLGREAKNILASL